MAAVTQMTTTEYSARLRADKMAEERRERRAAMRQALKENK